MARQTGDDSHLDSALAALDRMDELLGDVLRMARQGEAVGQTEPVSVREVAETAWTHVATADAALTVEADAHIVADRGRLTQLFENLFINAVEHGSTSPDSRDHGGDGESAEDAETAVGVGLGPDGTLFVEDDGPGIPPEERSNVFKSGYTTRESGTGYGLAIVRQVARAHDWEVGITESADGGARFEFRGIELAEE
jgi:signal transduction histidine kinase